MSPWPLPLNALFVPPAPTPLPTIDYGGETLPFYLILLAGYEGSLTPPTFLLLLFPSAAAEMRLLFFSLNYDSCDYCLFVVTL